MESLFSAIAIILLMTFLMFLLDPEGVGSTVKVFMCAVQGGC